jgi:membrane-bound lytic murein transglycosylase A
LAPPASLPRAAGNIIASAQFVPEPFSSLPGWPEDDHRPAYEAFRRSAAQAGAKPYRTSGFGVPCSAFGEAFAVATGLERPDRAAARDFFERHFRPYLIDNGAPGFLTGYYEPEAQASPVRTPEFTVPLYRRPDDLVDIDEESPPSGIEKGYRFARRTAAGPVPYFDRRAIETGALAGRGLEIAWLADPVDTFFIHVQGAARLSMTDGSSLRVTYAAKSGHPVTGPGRVRAAPWRRR